MTLVRQMTGEITLGVVLLGSRDRYLSVAFLAGILAAVVAIYIYKNRWKKDRKTEKRLQG